MLKWFEFWFNTEEVYLVSFQTAKTPVTVLATRTPPMPPRSSRQKYLILQPQNMFSLQWVVKGAYMPLKYYGYLCIEIP